LHPTQFGKICPNETPEGPNCVGEKPGILAKISEGSDPEELEAVIKK
jgi:DNA-directed RNA polymerase subunit B"